MQRLILAGDYVVEDCTGRGQVDATVIIENERVAAIMASAEARRAFPGEPVIGGAGHVVIPGLIDAHQHGRGVSNIQRGVPDGPLEQWLTRLRGLWPMDTYLTTAVAALRLLRSGVTTAMHHFTSTGIVPFEEELAASLKAYRDLGIRVTFTLDFRDRFSYVYADDEEFLAALPAAFSARVREKLPPRSASDPDKVMSLLPSLQRDCAGTLMKFALGPQGPDWSSDAGLEKIGDFSRANDLPVHTHVLETRLQREASIRNHGMSPVERLSRFGLLNDRTSLAHMVWPSAEDLVRVQDNGAIVVHNPASNLRLKSGIAPVLEMLRRDIPVAIGMDGTSMSDQADFFQDLRLCQGLHFDRAGAIAADDIWRMVYRNGGKATFWGDAVGQLAKGCWGDAAVIRLTGDRLVEPIEPQNVLQRVLREGSPAAVHASVVGGRVVMKGGRSTLIDDADLLARVDTYARNVDPAAVHERRRLVEELEGAVSDFYRSWKTEAGPRAYNMMALQ
jgi:5-methylthioadenosine/S-adenosylhomocysteine deaminase